MKRALSARVPDFQQKLSPALNNDPWMKSGRKNQIVTEEDIFSMKQELQALIREKNLLKNKIVALMDIEKNSQTNYVPNPKVSKNSLSKEIKELENYNQKKRNEITSLLQSDSVAKITEMQEEIVIIYEELQRLTELKRQIDVKVKESCENLDQTIKTFSPETVARNQKTIIQLERDIAIQEERNRIAKENLEKNDSQPSDEQIEHAKFVMEFSIQILQKNIEDEENEINRLDSEIEIQQANN
ncbi:hypothetical protein M9Y10_041726 [Tritrichomonas musculus]|uniref:Uncharacterized protein n=1 Tax=Tritrichomonas musculus TaxID=1915356 RepID=A0ABR2K893_9EUKA